MTLYSRRNDFVHGRWSADANHRQVARSTPGGAYAGAFTVSSWDGGWLEQVASDLTGFFERARAELFARIGIAAPPALVGPHDDDDRTTPLQQAANRLGVS